MFQCVLSQPICCYGFIIIIRVPVCGISNTQGQNNEPHLALKYNLLQIKPNTCMAAVQYQLKKSLWQQQLPCKTYLARPICTPDDGQLVRNM